MIVRKLSELEPERTTEGKTWISRRLLLRGDQMGYSVHDTIIKRGTETHLHYKNHLEAVYCIQGRGSVELVPSGETFVIEPGTIYALDENDKHILRAEEEMRMVCVFNPPLHGKETHGPDGAYPVLDDDGKPIET